MTPDNEDAGFPQHTDSVCAGPSQFFPRKFKVAQLAVPLGDVEVMQPTLPVGLPLEVKLIRPCFRVDAILANPHPAAGQQSFQTAAALEVVYFNESAFGRCAASAAVCPDVCSRYVPAHVLRVFRIPLKPFLEITFDHT